MVVERRDDRHEGGTIMAEPFIFINTYAVKEGKLQEYLKRHHEVVELTQANEPRLLHFGCYLSEDGAETSTVQVHADADNMLVHMQLAGEHIREASELLDFSRMSIQIYGSPTDAVLEEMRKLAGTGVPVNIKKHRVGFTRLAQP
jgi:hypothetical protein